MIEWTDKMYNIYQYSSLLYATFLHCAIDFSKYLETQVLKCVRNKPLSFQNQMQQCLILPLSLDPQLWVTHKVIGRQGHWPVGGSLFFFFFFLERISYNWVAFISIFRTIYDDRTCPGQEQTMCSWMLRVVCGICASCLALSCPAARPYKSGGAALGEAFFRKRAQVFPSAKLHIVSLASATCNHYSKLLRALHSWRWKLKSLVL